jgi:hypothetical protein
MSSSSMINTFDFSCLVDCLQKAFATLKLVVALSSIVLST